jgi:hypothetical protein
MHLSDGRPIVLLLKNGCAALRLHRPGNRHRASLTFDPEQSVRAGHLDILPRCSQVGSLSVGNSG